MTATSCETECRNCGAVFSPAPGESDCQVCAQTLNVKDSASPVPTSTAVVDSLPGHHVADLLGRGGMGFVYRARQSNLMRDVAAKVTLTAESDAEGIERFIREAHVLAQLDHPNIVPIYDYGRNDEGFLFYTMKLVRGRTLTAILKDLGDGTGSCSQERLLEVFRKICDAVAFAHSRGVMHRDLKPDNIMVGEFGEVLVMDWGLAGSTLGKDQANTPKLNPVTIDSGEALTIAGVVIGTPQYMSPEQADGRTDIDARCDIYSLGGLLYAMLTLQPPIPKASVNTMLQSVRAGNITRVDQVKLPAGSKRLPHSLVAVAMKALALRREDRFQTVEALATDIDAYLGGFATSAEHVTPLGLLWLLIKRNRVFSFALLTLLALSAAFVVSLIASERRATQSAEEATRQARAATSAERIATEKTEASRIALARARISVADAAYRDTDTAATKAELASVPEDLRDNTWHYLAERANDSVSQPRWQETSFFIGCTAHPKQPGVFAAATDSPHGRIVIFDGRTGRILRDFPMQSNDGWTRALSFSPDGKYLAVGWLQSKGITIYDAETGARIRHWDATKGSLRIAFSPDGTKLLQTLISQELCLYDASTGDEIWRAQSGLRHFYLPDGTGIVAISRSHVRIHSADDGKELQSFSFRAIRPDSVSVSPDGKTLVFTSEKDKLIGINIADGATRFELKQEEEGSTFSSAFTPDSIRFITVVGQKEDSIQSIRIRDAATGSTIRRLRGGTGNIETISVHPLSGELLIAGGSTRVWRTEMKSPDWAFKGAGVGHSGGFFGGETTILTQSESFHAVAGRLTATSPLKRLTQIFDRRGVLDPRIGTATQTWKSMIEECWSVSTSGDGRVAAIHDNLAPKQAGVTILRANGTDFTESCKVSVWNEPYRMVLNRDGSRIVTMTGWAQDKVHLTTDGKLLPKLEFIDAVVATDTAWHGSDGKILFTAFTLHDRRGGPKAEEWLIAWDTDTGKRIGGAKHSSFLNCLAAEPGGNLIADAGMDKNIRIRDAATLAVIREFRAHDSSITSLAWSSRDNLIASSSADNTVRVWDSKTGRMIEELYSGPTAPGALFFSPGGTRLACALHRGDTLVWSLKAGAEK